MENSKGHIHLDKPTLLKAIQDLAVRQDSGVWPNGEIPDWIVTVTSDIPTREIQRQTIAINRVTDQCLIELRQILENETGYWEKHQSRIFT